MKVKLFMNSFFENRRIFILFLIILTIIMSYLGIQLMIIDGQSQHKGSPDISMGGKLDADGVYRYKFYSNLSSELYNDIKALNIKELRVYPAIIRNIAYINNPKVFRSVNYSFMGVEQEFFDREINNYIVNGRIPRKENEIVIGTYAATYFDVELGEELPIGLTLKDSNENDTVNYEIVGILSPDIEFLNSAILAIDNTDFEKNFMMLYMENNNVEQYNEVIKLIGESDKDYGIGSMKDVFTQKETARTQKRMYIGSTCVIGLAILIMMILYLIKGFSKKIELMKALGIRNKTVYKIFLSGLTLIMLGSMFFSIIVLFIAKIYLNQSISEFYGFKVEVVKFSPMIFIVLMLFMLGMILVMALFLYYKTTRISPKEALSGV